MDTLELNEAVVATRALDSSDKIVARLIARRTGYALCKLRRKGVVTSRRLAGTNSPMEWRIA